VQEVVGSNPAVPIRYKRLIWLDFWRNARTAKVAEGSKIAPFFGASFHAQAILAQGVPALVRASLRKVRQSRPREGRGIQRVSPAHGGRRAGGSGRTRRGNRVTLFNEREARGLGRSPDREVLEQEFFDKGLKFYEQPARTNATDWAASRERARAYSNVGLLRLELREYPKSEEAFLKAIHLMEATRQTFACSTSLVCLSTSSPLE
jgi:hypothetical protein